MPTDSQRRVRTQLTFEEERYYHLCEQGILFVNEEIEDVYVLVINRDLLYMRNLPALKGKPIWIILNSPGGNVYHALALHDMLVALRETGVTVNILGMGVIASASAMILQAGSRRFSLPHTQFMLHQVHDIKVFKDEEVNEALESAEELKRINEVVMKIIAERTGKPPADLLRETTKTELWLDANGAKQLGEHGLIDEIITKLPF